MRGEPIYSLSRDRRGPLSPIIYMGHAWVHGMKIWQGTHYLVKYKSANFVVPFAPGPNNEDITGENGVNEAIPMCVGGLLTPLVHWISMSYFR